MTTARTATLDAPYDENGNSQTASLTTCYFGGACYENNFHPSL